MVTFAVPINKYVVRQALGFPVIMFGFLYYITDTKCSGFLLALIRTVFTFILSALANKCIHILYSVIVGSGCNVPGSSGCQAKY
jgi:hypothetical protein